MIHPFPTPEPPRRITKDLKPTVFQLVLHDIEEELPREQQPAQFAESLIAIATEYGYPIEWLRVWIGEKKPGKEFTCAAFRRIAEAYDRTRPQRLCRLE